MSKCFCHLNGFEVKDAKARKDIEKMKSKKFLFIGDSYSAHDVNIVDFCVNALGLTSNDFYKYAQGGYGFVGGIGTFVTLLANAISNIADKDSITDIVVCGGLNDIAKDDSTLVNAIIEFSNIAKQNFKNATIHIGNIGWWRDSSKIGAQTGRVVRQYKEGTVKSNVNYLHGLEYSMHDYRMLADDNIHPKDTSVYKWLGQCLAQTIKTGKCSVNFVNYDRTLTPSNDFEIQANRSFKAMEIVDNNLTTFTLESDLQMLSANGVQIKFLTGIELGTLNTGLVMGAAGQFNNSFVPISFMCVVKNNSQQYNFNGYLYISNNKLCLCGTSPEIANLSSNVLVSSIVIPRFSITMQTTYC